MPYLVDGHNLIPHIPGLSLSQPDDEERLIMVLQTFAGRKRTALEVFFDQAAPGQAGVRKVGGISAHFIARGRTADEAIAARLRKLGKKAAEYTVISSDLRVQGEARRTRARVLSSAEFAKLLAETGQTGAADPGSDPKLAPSASEVDEWLALFNERKRGANRP